MPELSNLRKLKCLIPDVGFNDTGPFPRPKRETEGFPSCHSFCPLMSMLTANPLPRSKHELEGLPLTFAVGASPLSAPLVGVLSPSCRRPPSNARRKGGSFSPQLHSRFKCELMGFLHRHPPFPSLRRQRHFNASVVHPRSEGVSLV